MPTHLKTNNIMKSKLLFNICIAIVISGASIMSTNAQVVTCHDATVSSANDFWLNNFYFSKCTDYISTGGKDISDPLWSSYVDFNGGASIDFTNIRVSQDGAYTARLTYGIGWAEAIVGANFNLIVNDEFIGNYTVFAIENPDPAVPRTIDLPVTLSTDWDNVIKIEQVKDWPTTLGIQLMRVSTGISDVKQKTFTVSGINKSIQINKLTNKSNFVEIYSIEGKLIDSKTIQQESFVKAMEKGLYIVKVNGIAAKVVVQ